jgi:hypothetical protein
MAFNLPPPPTSNDPKDPAFRDWFYKLQKAFSTLGSIAWSAIDFTGSNITDIVTRNHADLQNLNTASYTHLTSTQATDLTDGGDTTLHFHSSDRNLANATGVLDEVNGGTGQSTITSGDLLYGSAANTISKLSIGTNTEVLTIVAGLPSWEPAPATGVTSVDVSGGTTGLTFSGGPITSSGTITMAGTLDETNGGTNQTTYTTGDILYASASNTLSKLPVGSEGEGLVIASGVPSWGSVTSLVKVYEPTVVAGFDLNVTYIGPAPTVPAFVTTADGDIVMAWGGSYAA